MATDLRSRIATVGGNQAAALGHYHPSASIPGGMVMPMTSFYVTADRVQVQQMTPLYTDPNAAPIPATAPGRWVQLYAAGRG
jgi:hypothetical protein